MEFVTILSVVALVVVVVLLLVVVVVVVVVFLQTTAGLLVLEGRLLVGGRYDSDGKGGEEKEVLDEHGYFGWLGFVGLGGEVKVCLSFLLNRFCVKMTR